jgi:hypothetical protein
VATPSTRIEIQIPVHATIKQRHELDQFARYCIQRIERELGEREAWTIEIAPTLDGYVSRVIVSDGESQIEGHGRGHDGPLAIWDAVCTLEQRLRDRR